MIVLIYAKVSDKRYAKLVIYKVAGGLLGFGAMVVVWVDGEGLLPSVAVCLV
jgi:hypothetical protein